MRKLLSSLFTLLLTVGAFAQQSPNLYRHLSDSLAMVQWSDSVFDAMTPEERIGQLFMPIVEVKNTPQNKELIRRYIQEMKIGGILYSKGTSARQAELNNYAQGLAKVPLFISLDGEWGLAMRLTDTPRFPRNMMLGAVNNDSLIAEYGKEVGRQCAEMGIHINFAPVLDMNSNPNNPVINTRSFGEEKDLVSRKSIAYASGLESQRVLAVGKHFPGHGDTADDSHHTLPVLAHDSARMYEYEMEPFRNYVDAGFSGMLTAHLSVPALDESGVPSSLSEKMVGGILKKELAFSGLVFTDGLAMKGVSSQPDFCVKALLAGNDVLLGPANMATQVKNVRDAVADGRLPMSVVEEKCLKILRYKYIAGLTASKNQINLNGLHERLNTAHTRALNRKLHAEAITVLKDDNALLPLQRLDEKRIGVVSVGRLAEDAFPKTLARYNRQQFLTWQAGDKNSRTQVLSQTKEQSLLIVGIQSDKAADVEFVRTLCEGKRFILVFFTSPYRMQAYKRLIGDSEGVVLAYENSKLAGECAAEVIYGGLPAKGTLSVSVPGLFKSGAGIHFDQVRLGYVYPEEEQLDSKVLSKIDLIVKEGMAKKAFPGCQVLVARNGNIIYERAFGFFDYAGSKEVELDDLYDLASVTKGAATVPAVMKVRDDYKMRIADPLSRYIPELKGTDKASLTIREALFHETGMASGHPFYRMAMALDSLKMPLFKAARDVNYRLRADKNLYAHKDFRFRTALVSNSFSEECPIEVAQNFYLNSTFKDSILHKLTALPLKNRGSYRYSCLNFVMLRQMVENITHQPLDKYLTTQLYAPLGANDLMFNPRHHYDSTKIAPTENDEFLRKQLLVGYVHDEISAFSGGVEGNAGLFGNAGDLAKLLQLWLNEGEYGGERYFTRETVRLFTMTKSPKSRRGLGFDKPDTRNPRLSPTAPQAPASVYGHTGFTGTCFWVDPDNKLIYIFLTNRVYPHRWNKQLMIDNYRTRIQEVIYEAMK
ncbi:MAG: glycoside hydrolase family 3 N-terminal domain-containing protein [Bacteroidales bacterium]